MVNKNTIIEKYIEIVEIAKKAGDAIMNIYNSEEFKIEFKKDQSPLTLADKVSHEIITEELKKYNLPVLSEEGVNISHEERSKWDLYWLIDPIDGTKEFINKNGEFTVNIALIENKKPVFGVVSLPIKNIIYVGGENMEAIAIDENIERRLFDNQKNNCKNIVVASKSHLNKETENYINGLNNPTTIQVGSSLKFMMLAENKASVYPRFGPTMEWDIAASHAILNSLGYQVNNIDGSQILYNKENLLNPFFIAQ